MIPGAIGKVRLQAYNIYVGYDHRITTDTILVENGITKCIS